mmetsp:Transcript_57046/g.69674  ORF Transcript_57046/g.69674 Transcript_57046/m.69674 type:complete len:146 (-) Transcript_57046:27-464(-)
MAQKPQTVKLSLDENEKKELAELQAQLTIAQQTNDLISQNIGIQRRRLLNSKNNLDTIESLNSDTNTWLSVGKMFILQNRTQIKGFFNKQINNCDKKINDLELQQKKTIETLDRQRKIFNTFINKHRYVDNNENKSKPALDSIQE